MSSFLAYGHRFIRSTLRDPCPVCARRKSAGRCAVSEDGALGICMHTESDRPLRSGLGWLHVLTPGVLLHPRALTDEPPVRIGPDLAPPDRLDAVLGALVAHPILSLTNRHRQGLLRRGLDAETVRANGYATLPGPGRSRAVRDVRARFDTEGVPGVFYSRRGRGEGYWTLAGAQGLLVPVRDAEGRIRGAQVRPDGATSEGGKYRWVSSSGREGGTGSGTPLHWTLSGDPEGDLWITEGPLKSDVAAALSGHRFLGFAGCHPGQGRRLVDELARAGHPRARPLVLAVDADWREKKDVRRAFAAIARALDRAGYRVLVATWSPEFGKGIDDALFNGARIGEDVSLVPVETFTGDTPRLRERREVTPWLPPSTVSLAEAEARIRELCEGLIQRPVRGCHVLAATFGIGKTRNACRVLAHGYRFDTVPTFRGRGGTPRRLRACVLTDTREQAQVIAGTLHEEGLTEDGFALLVGRDTENCARHAEADALGAHRHSPAAELCGACPYADGCAYLAQRHLAHEADLVVTCKPALLSESSDLRRFDLVVVDEDLLPTLFDPFDLTREHLDRWRVGMDALPDRFPEGSPYRSLVRVLELALSSWRNDGTDNTQRPETRNPALPTLRRVAEHLDLDLDGLVAELTEAVKQDRSRTGRLPFESPWGPDGEGGYRLRDRMPLRAFGDLVAMLTDELTEPRRDTRLWFDVNARGVTPGDSVPGTQVRLLLYRPLDRVLDALRNTAVLVLDATPDLARLRLIFGEDRVHVTELAVPERLHVTQLSDRLRQTDPDVRAAIRARVAEEVGEPPVVLTRKRIAEVVDRERLDAAGIRAGWFGRHHRATNEFEGEAALVVEDHYALPPDEYRARVEMWRFSGPPEGVPPVYAPYEGTEFEALLPGAGEESDPDVAAYARHSWGAEVRQAIGRLRACRQDREVRVVVTSRDPVPGLRVHRLVTVQEYLTGERRPISERRLATLLDANLDRQRETAERVDRALRAYLTERGHLPSRRKLQALTGCRATVARDALRRAEEFYGGGGTAVGTSTTVYNRLYPPPHKTGDTSQTVGPQRIPAEDVCTPSAVPPPSRRIPEGARPLFPAVAVDPQRGRPQARVIPTRPRGDGRPIVAALGTRGGAVC
jgi:hypothetical protein